MKSRRLLTSLWLVGLLCAGQPAIAHVAEAEQTSIWWSVDLWSALLLIALAGCYVRGRRTGRLRARIWRGSGAVMFWAGWSFLLFALGPPVDPLGGLLFSMHMVQHEILMLIAAPLLVLSRPSGYLLWGLPTVARRAFARLNRSPRLRSGGHWLVSPQGAWIVHAVALWAWHVPVLFNASLTNDAVHMLQHLSFFVSALLFWSALLLSRNPVRNAVAIIYLFTTAMHSGLLGALLTFSPAAWYAPYQATTALFDLTPLEDQQLGGLIMWVPSSLVFLAAGLVLGARCLGDDRAVSAPAVYRRIAGRNRV